MRAIRVVQIAPHGYHHAACLDECASLVTAAARDLGHPTERVYNEPDPRALNVVVGWHLLRDASSLAGAECVAWQLEAIGAEGSGWWTYAREAVLRSFSGVWDFDARNLAFLRARGFPRSARLPLGHHAVLATLPDAPEDVDVVAYGSVNERRLEAFEACRAAGLTVRVVPFGTYGRERDAAIAGAKCVLGVNFYPRLARFDQVRAAFLLANGRRYVVESAPDAAAPSAGFVDDAPYDELAARCAAWCAAPPEQRRVAVAMARDGFARFFPMTRYVADALAAHERGYRDD